MSTNLDQIISVVRARVEQNKRVVSLRQMERAAKEPLRPPRGFRKALAHTAAEGGIAIIAELKKASPSRGVLRGTFHVGGLATQFEKAGASALSVLTEEQFFAGSLGNLREASAASSLPCLRKDFIVDEYQLFEARANAADAVLLIAAALSDAEMANLYVKARKLSMDVLCEVHNESELTRVVAIGADMIGVNSRDLRTLQVDMTTHERLAGNLPAQALRVAESGIADGKGISNLRGRGYQAFLVGELLMKSENPGATLSQLIAEAKTPTTA